VAVTARWKGGTNAVATVTTGADGRALFTTPWSTGKNRCWSLSVVTLAGEGILYDPMANGKIAAQAGPACHSGDTVVNDPGRTAFRSPARTLAAGGALRFRLDRPGPTSLVLYDLAGRRVARLLEASLAAGDHAVAWSGRDAAGQAVAQGVYFAILRHPDGVSRQRVLLLR